MGYFKKIDPRVLELFADIMLIDDAKDIGQFDHIHHWLSGYVMKSLSQARNLPPDQRKAKIISDLTKLHSSERRLRFIGDR